MIYTFIGIVCVYFLANLVIKRFDALRPFRNGIFILLGFLLSEGITNFGVDLEIRWFDLKFISAKFFFPLLIINSLLEVLEIKNRTSVRQGIKSAGLSILSGVTLLSVLYYIVVGHPQFFSFQSALLCALILMTSDNGMITPFVKKKAAKFLRIESEILSSILLISIWGFLNSEE